jgi:plasmid stabilization system protein ParE
MIVEWWEDAKSDLDSIYEYIANLNERSAAKVYNEILDEIDKLTQYAESLPVEPLIKSKKYIFRFCITVNGKYKIIYFVDGKRIIITHIWDCRRNPDIIRQYF